MFVSVKEEWILILMDIVWTVMKNVMMRHVLAAQKIILLNVWNALMIIGHLSIRKDNASAIFQMKSQTVMVHAGLATLKVVRLVKDMIPVPVIDV